MLLRKFDSKTMFESVFEFSNIKWTAFTETTSAILKTNTFLLSIHKLPIICLTCCIIIYLAPPMLLPVFELAFANLISQRRLINSLTVWHIILPSAFVCITVCILHHSLPFPNTAYPLSFINISIRKFLCCLPLFSVLVNISFNYFFLRFTFFFFFYRLLWLRLNRECFVLWNGCWIFWCRTRRGTHWSRTWRGILLRKAWRGGR